MRSGHAFRNCTSRVSKKPASRIWNGGGSQSGHGFRKVGSEARPCAEGKPFWSATEARDARRGGEKKRLWSPGVAVWRWALVARPLPYLKKSAASTYRASCMAKIRASFSMSNPLWSVDDVVTLIEQREVIKDRSMLVG